MSERIDTPLTNEHFAAFCLSMLGQPYWYGTALHKCSESLRASKARQYPSHYGSSRTSRYRDDIAKKKVCADCMGGAKGYAWTSGGQGVLEAIGNGQDLREEVRLQRLPGQVLEQHVLVGEVEGHGLGHH